MFSPTVDNSSFTRREDSIQFLLGRENYERWRKAPYDSARMGLQRMRRLLEEIGSPERSLPIIHIAGTKGKGSTSAMIAASLSAAGYRTGLFTSPHLQRIEQRMTIDGQPCEAEEFIALVDLLRPAVEALDRRADQCQSGPTFFEITTAMAFLHFQRQNVQAAVLEVGLGGRLDATNVCQPTVSVITNISFDHTQQLGNTLAAIAGEKAGIIKPGVPVVSGVVEPEARDVIRQVCQKRGCRLVERDADYSFDYRPPRHLEREAANGQVVYRPEARCPLPADPQSASRYRGYPEVFKLALPGRHQAANAATALATLDVLRQALWSIPVEAVQRALAGLSWPARVQVISRRPAVVLDAAHNVASIQALVETLEESFSAARRLLIFATTHDKDVRGMLQCLQDHFDEVYFTRYSNNSRAVPPEELQQAAEELTGRRWPALDDPTAAWKAAQRSATANDLICITGSFFLAAEMGPLIEKENSSDK
ncbi:MAG: bifunctional folylpolyglutamate synthase/dihydrofolate synthase [Thermoguttaceae bacterium]